MTDREYLTFGRGNIESVLDSVFVAKRVGKKDGTDSKSVFDFASESSDFTRFFECQIVVKAIKMRSNADICAGIDSPFIWIGSNEGRLENGGERRTYEVGNINEVRRIRNAIR